METIKTFARLLGKYKRETILSPALTAVEVILDVLIPYVIARLIDQGIQGQNMAAVWKYGGIMFGLGMLSLVSGVIAGRLAATASTGFAANLRAAMYRKIQTYSFSNIDRFSTASLVTRMTTDVTNVQNAFQMIIRIATRAPVMLIMSIVMCIITSPSLSTIFLVAMVVLVLGLSTIIAHAIKIFNQAFQKYDDLNSSVEENVAAARVVKAYVREEYEKEKFARAARAMRSIFTQAQKWVALNMPVMSTVTFGCIIALSWFGAKQVVGSQLTTGALTSMFSYVMQILMNLMMLSMIFVMLSMSAASARRIAAVLNEEPDIRNPDEPVMSVEDGSIDYDHVSFYYQKGAGEAVLQDIDIHIRSGETVGVIGGTGSGKSTLVNLLSRLYDVQEGSVRIGGRDVREYDLEALRDSVSVVLQKNVLFSGTILSNLRWGKADATEEDCREVCRLACAD